MNGKHLLAAFGIASALLAAIPEKSFGAEAPPAAKPGPLTGVITIKDEGYTLTVRTPDGWQGDTEAAKPFHGKVLFTPKTGSGPKILLSVVQKFSENANLFLQGDIERTRKQYPSLELADLDMKHPKYQVFAKTLSQPGQFFVYEAYLNPGSVLQNALFAQMSKAKEPATPAELAAYKEIVQSLQIVPAASTAPKVPEIGNPPQ
jgi:hypothetical protein